MSKLFRFLEILSFEESCEYLSYLIKEDVEEKMLLWLIHHDYLLVYKNLNAQIVPVKLDGSSRIMEIDFGKRFTPVSRYNPVHSSSYLYVLDELAIELASDESNWWQLGSCIKDDDGNTYTYVDYGKDLIIDFTMQSSKAEFYRTNDIVDIAKICLIEENYFIEPTIKLGSIEIDAIDQNNETTKFYLASAYDNQRNIKIKDDFQPFFTGTREKNSLHRVIAALLVINKIEGLGHYKIAETLINAALLKGIDCYPSNDTVAKIIKAAKEYLPNDNPN